MASWLGDGPPSEEAEAMFGGRGRLGGVHEESLPWVPGRSTAEAQKHPQRDSNPCRHLERVIPAVSGVGSRGLEPEFTGSEGGLSRLIWLELASVE